MMMARATSHLCELAQQLTQAMGGARAPSLRPLSGPFTAAAADRMP